MKKDSKTFQQQGQQGRNQALEAIMNEEEYNELLKTISHVVVMRRFNTKESFDFHAAILGLNLCQGVRNTFEQLLLNNVSVTPEIISMLVLSHFAEKIRRKLRVDMNCFTNTQKI